MLMQGGDTESSSCINRVPKVEVYREVLRVLKESDCVQVFEPDFEDQLWSHFNRLPIRYALDVNLERAQEVLIHKKLLHMAYDPTTRPAFEVRLIRLHPGVDENGVDSTSKIKDAQISIHPSMQRSFHEITISTTDKPKLLSKLTSLLSDIGLNIQEARAFSTTDGYALDVFVVSGWPDEETEKLRETLAMEIPKVEVYNFPHLGTNV